MALKLSIKVTQISFKKSINFSHHTICITNKNNPGTTKSSDPTDHLR